MERPTARRPVTRRRRPSVSVTALCTAVLLTVLPAGALCTSADDRHPIPPEYRTATARQLEETLGISIFPGSSLIALEGPTLELVDLERPEWEYTAAHVLAADFLVDAPISELRRFYRHLCVRDPKLLLVKKNSVPGEIVSVRHAGRHPLHPQKRWLRIVTYRLAGPAIPETP